MGEIVAFPRRPPPGAADYDTAAEPLWREAVGRELRRERQRTERTLADVAERAGVSPQHLSEVERGLKEPSSEVLGAVAGALGVRLVDLAARVARSLQTSHGSGPVLLAA